MTGPRVAFVGGGSGGDAYPLLSVARALGEAAGGEVPTLFFASADGIENTLYAKAGVEVAHVPAMRLYRKNLPFLPFVLARGVLAARSRLAAFAPDLVVALGGFVSPPVVLAARTLGVPVAILEPNSVGGRANRVLARFASLVVTGHESAAATFPDPSRVECLGHALRFEPDEERRAARRSARPAGELTVTVSGGSLGARILNDATSELYAELGSREGLRVIHVTGRRDHASCRARYQAAGSPPNIELRDYVDQMDLLYEDTDLMVCRAGAMTVSELVAFRVPAAFVPLAIAPGDHQYENAKPLVDAGCAELAREDAFSAARLRAWVDAALADPAALRARREAFAGLGRPPGAPRIAARLLELVRGAAPGPCAEGEVAGTCR